MDEWTPAKDCTCFFCRTGAAHPDRHTETHPISSRLLKAESLMSRDRVERRACRTCGHITEIIPQ